MSLKEVNVSANFNCKYCFFRRIYYDYNRSHPLYRSSIGFDRFGSLLNTALRGEQASAGYPPYNIEITGEDRYGIVLALAGFKEDELDIQVERDVLTVSGKKSGTGKVRDYLYQGIANRSFERKFTLADHVEVTGARLENGLLHIELIKEIPEAMKAKKITIDGSDKVILTKRLNGCPQCGNAAVVKTPPPLLKLKNGK